MFVQKSLFFEETSLEFLNPGNIFALLRIKDLDCNLTFKLRIQFKEKGFTLRKLKNKEALLLFIRITYPQHLLIERNRLFYLGLQNIGFVQLDNFEKLYYIKQVCDKNKEFSFIGLKFNQQLVSSFALEHFIIIKHHPNEKVFFFNKYIYNFYFFNNFFRFLIFQDFILMKFVF